MFEISEDTKAKAVKEMTEIFERNGDSVTESVVGDAFDAAVAIVKKQFGF